MAIKFLNTATAATQAVGDNSTKIATTAYADAAASAIPIGNYLPLSAGSTKPLTGSLYIPNYIYHAGDAGTFIGFPSNDRLIIGTNGGTRVDITNSGFCLGDSGSNISVSTILDEDDMASDSATALVTQQSIKAYVDAQTGTGTYLPLTGGTLTGPLAGTSATFSSNITSGSTTKTTSNVIRSLASDTVTAGFEAYGASQGTGYAYVGQSTSHGGGMFYNGDGTPAFATGETADRVSFYRRTASANTVVFEYAHNSSTVVFKGEIYVELGSIVLQGTGRIQGIDTVSAATDAANKAYVDAHDGGAGVYLPLAGGTLTGPLAGTSATFSTTVTATGGFLVPYASATKKPMINLVGATNYGLWHTEGSDDIFSFDFGGVSKQQFFQSGNAIFAGTITGQNIYGNQFVDAQDNAYYANPAATSVMKGASFDGNVTVTTQAVGNNSTLVATTAYVDVTASQRTPLNDIRSLGTPAFTNGTNPNITTAQVMAEIEGDGGFDSYSSVFKTSWSYAGNYNLTDAGDFTETAGSSWLTWTDNSSDTTRGNITTLAIAPNSGGSAGGVFIYNDQGASYSPGWRQVWTSTTDGAGSGLDADKLDGQEGSYYATAASLGNYLPLSGGAMTGSIAMGNNDITNINTLTFQDPGVNEGIKWNSGNLWQIYESPNAQTNASGNLQFVQNTTRRLTINTGGDVEIVSGNLTVGGGTVTLGGISGRLTGIVTILSGSDATNKTYVDNAIAGVPQGDITGVTAGTGMTGGGTSGTVTLNVIGGSGITANANDITVDSTVVRTTGGQTITGNKVFQGTTSTSHNSAPIELYSSGSGSGATPPRISFHWGGVVASQISIEAGGEIAIRDNPGTGYEDLKARMFRATSGVSYFAGGLATSGTQSRNKLGVWSSNSTYTIGMMSGYGYGGLGGNSTSTEYAMSFQMSNDANRGWWWGDIGHTNLQGAMSLTTTGKAVIATSLSIGYGESVRTAAIEILEVNGKVKANGLKLMSGTTATLNTGSYSNMAYLWGYASGSTIHFGQPATWTQNIRVAGTATATNFILSSDKTLKNKIKEIDTNHIDVNWKNFELKSEPGVKRAGVIAQELEEKHPEFVRTDDEGMKSVAYIDLLITKIAELEARLEKAGI